MIPAKPPNGQSSSSDAPGGPNWQRVARMDAEFLRTTVGDRLAKAVAAAAESGADDKVEYIADWLLNQVSVEEAGVAAAEQAAAVAELQAAADAAAAEEAAAAAAVVAAREEAVASVAAGSEVLRCDALPEALRPPLPGAYSAAIEALLAHSSFSDAHVAEVDFGELPAAEEGEGEAEEAAEGEGGPASGATAMRYVESSQDFVKGKVLSHGSGVSLAAADSGSVVRIANVLLDPSVKFMKRKRFGSYACAPVTNPLDGAVIAMLAADTLADGSELTDTDVDTLTALAAALGAVHAAGVAAAQADLAAKLSESTPTVGEYVAEAEPEEPAEPTEEEAEAAASAAAAYVEEKKAALEEKNAALEEGEEPEEFDEAAATAEYEEKIAAEKAAAELAVKQAAADAAAAAKTAVEDDLRRLDAYDKSQLGIYGARFHSFCQHVDAMLTWAFVRSRIRR